MQGGDAGVGKGTEVLGVRTPMRAARSRPGARPLLCVGECAAGNRKRGGAGQNHFPHERPPKANEDDPSRRTCVCLIKLNFGQTLMQRNVDVPAFTERRYMRPSRILNSR